MFQFRKGIFETTNVHEKDLNPCIQYEISHTCMNHFLKLSTFYEKDLNHVFSMKQVTFT